MRSFFFRSKTADWFFGEKNVGYDFLKFFRTAEWRGTQGYFEKLNKVYLFWHFGGKKIFWGYFFGHKNFLGVYLEKNLFWGQIWGQKSEELFFRSKTADCCSWRKFFFLGV